MLKIDVKDRKIIYQLSLDSRQTSSQIAKKVGLSQQSVDYKIKRLEKLNIIKGYYTCIDISKIGYSIFKIYIKLQNLDEKKEQEMIEDLKNNDNVTWVGTCDGMWDLYLVFWSKNIFQFNEIFTEINNKYSYYFSKKAIIANTKVLQFMRKHLALNKKDMDFSKIEWAGEISEAKVDEIDIKILLAIALNARMPDTQIAKKLKISRKVVAYRIKHLIQERIIYSFKPFLNGGLLGYKTYKLFITLQSLTKEKEHSLMTYLQHHPNVIEVVYCIGSWELEIDIESSSIDINHNIIRELRSKFTDVIREVDVMHVYKTHKYLYIAPGLVDIS